MRSDSWKKGHAVATAGPTAADKWLNYGYVYVRSRLLLPISFDRIDCVFFVSRLLPSWSVVHAHGSLGLEIFFWSARKLLPPPLAAPFRDPPCLPATGFHAVRPSSPPSVGGVAGSPEWGVKPWLAGPTWGSR